MATKRSNLSLMEYLRALPSCQITEKFLNQLGKWGSENLICSWSHSKCIEQAHFDSWFILFRKFLPAQMGILKIRTLSWWTSLGRAVVENNRSCRLTCITCKVSGWCWTAADMFRMLTPQGLSAFCQHLGSHRATLCSWDALQKDTNQEFWGPRQTEVDLWSKANQTHAFPHGI